MAASGQQQGISLSEDFRKQYEEFQAQYDKIAEDLFAGCQLHELAQAFYAKHKTYLESLPFSVETKYPNLSPNETIEDDARLLSQVEDNFQAPEWAKLVAQLYRRLTQAHYLAVTFIKSRQGQESNRLEGVEYGRRAFRYDPADFAVCIYFMGSLGWQLDPISNAKERTLAAKAFMEAIKRCLRINPNHHVAHHLLGRFYYNVANLSWLERTVANQVLSAKLEGSHKEAEQEFLEAHKHFGNWLPTGLYMARVLHAQKRPIEEVKKWIDFGLAQTDVDPTTELDRKELEEFKNKLKLAN